jgi:16S rRNA (cytosine967-C5)-methyltransferase
MANLTGRERALLNLIAIDEAGAYANLTGDRTPMPAGDRALANELTQGVTRRRHTLDWTLNQLLKNPVSTLTAPIRNILRLGAYQLLFLDRVPAAAAVNESVKLAKRYGHIGVAKLTNGVLRNLGRQQETLIPPAFSDSPLEALHLRYSLPEWLAKRWHEAYGEGAEALGLWSIQTPTLALRTNTLKTTPQALSAALSASNIVFTPSQVAPEGFKLQESPPIPSLPGFAEGWFYVQDEAAMLVSRILAPKPGETILDVGAAPGGKTTHLAQIMENQGEIWAIDTKLSRLKLLQENCERLGVTIVKPRVQDASDLKGLPLADRILLDVPCSGLGVLPRKPDLRYRQSPEGIQALQVIQLRLLDAAATQLKPGGTLLYSTCTISPEENQHVILTFLSTHPAFELGSLAERLPEAWRSDVEQGGMIQLWPPRHGVDGFFIALLARKSDS